MTAHAAYYCPDCRMWVANTLDHQCHIQASTFTIPSIPTAGATLTTPAYQSSDQEILAELKAIRKLLEERQK